MFIFDNGLPRFLIKSSPLCFIDDDNDEEPVDNIEGDEVDQDEEEDDAEEEGQDPEENEGEDDDEEEDEEKVLVVTIGDDDPDDDDTAKPWVKELRAKHRESKKEIRELKEKLKIVDQKKENETLGEKPTMDDFDHDEELFSTALLTWNDNKTKHDATKEEAKQKEQKQTDDWNTKLEDHGAKKKKLAVDDMDEVEDDVFSVLSQTQKGLIIHTADDSALLTYGIGKNRKVLEKLAAISDPTLFVKELTKIEMTMKTSKRKLPPPPERKITGTGSFSGQDKKLDKLEKQADKTGDRTRIIAYKKRLKEKRRA